MLPTPDLPPTPLFHTPQLHLPTYLTQPPPPPTLCTLIFLSAPQTTYLSYIIQNTRTPYKPPNPRCSKTVTNTRNPGEEIWTSSLFLYYLPAHSFIPITLTNKKPKNPLKKISLKNLPIKITLSHPSDLPLYSASAIKLPFCIFWVDIFAIFPTLLSVSRLALFCHFAWTFCSLSLHCQFPSFSIGVDFSLTFPTTPKGGKCDRVHHPILLPSIFHL